MAATARILVVLAACCLLAATAARSPVVVNAAAAEDDVVDIVDDAGNATAQDPAASVGKSGAAGSVDLIAAEAAAGAAQAAGVAAAARNGSAAAEWEVWDPEEENGVEATGKRPHFRLPEGMVPEWSKPEGLQPDRLKPSGLMPAGLMPEELIPPGMTPGEFMPEFVLRPDGAPVPPKPIAAPLDALMDFALGAMVHEFRAKHSTERPVPDFRKRFKARLGFITVHGHLDAQGGTVGDLSSLFRDGSVSMGKEADGTLVLNAAAGLRTVRLKYRHYSARAGPIRVSGQITAEASPSSLRAQLALVAPCRVQLRALSVASMGRLRVSATGLGALRRLLPLLEKWLEPRVRADVESSALRQIAQLVNAQLKRLAC